MRPWLKRQKLGWSVDFGKGHDELASINSPPADDPNGKLHQPNFVSAVNRELADAHFAHTSRGRLALTLGGDHSLAIGTVTGTLRSYPDACLIWIDAHAVRRADCDLSDLRTSTRP